MEGLNSERCREIRQYLQNNLRIDISNRIGEYRFDLVLEDDVISTKFMDIGTNYDNR